VCVVVCVAACVAACAALCVALHCRYCSVCCGVIDTKSQHRFCLWVRVWRVECVYVKRARGGVG